MIMTIQEANFRIENLQKEYNDFMKLQNYAMCLDLTKLGESSYTSSPEKDARRELLHKIREEADIVCDIRTLCTIGCELCKSEIKRIEEIVNNTKVSI